ncbi:PHP domain-containing protein [Desulforamulus ruminis]|uniref:PHP domain-containing protein n=1 Tax=Desulforamulus ruminis TaxID=1564 RepID=UPI0003021869|nr:PHP domain-containing protein [Desulforamulus ruminis]
MTLKADLHIHTTASDGSDTPAEVVQKALEAGLRAIAISDHDTLSGVKLAQQAAEGHGLEVLSGVEVNTYYEGREIHILGYLIDPNHPYFNDQLKKLQGDRLERVQQMIKKLKTFKINILLNRVLEIASGASVGRPHLAQAMVEKGYVTTRQEAFNLYIGAGKKAFIPRENLSPKDAIQLILQCRGVPVLAHPGLSKVENLLPELVSCGLKGLEVWHVSHPRLLEEHYHKVAQKYRLIATGGSDYHGTGHDVCNRLGAICAPYESVLQLKELAGK